MARFRAKKLDMTLQVSVTFSYEFDPEPDDYDGATQAEIRRILETDRLEQDGLIELALINGHMSHFQVTEL